MNAEKLFRTLLVFSALIVVIGGTIPVLELYETSEDLEVVLMWNGYGGIPPLSNGEITGPFEITVLILFGALVVALIAGYIGAFLFKNWGRLLLAAITLVSILATPAFGLFVALSVEMMFYELSAAAFYIALTMAFLPPLRDKFEKD